ncbi:MAG: c-type cytochrome [Isosphaerales bacterium]
MGTPTSTPEASHPSSPQPGDAVRSPERATAWAGTLFKGVVNLVTVLLIIVLTYHFTVFFARPSQRSWYQVFFATPGPVARSSTEADKALAKKAEEFRAQEHKILSSYGWVNPATKSVRIPVERAMELIAAESAQPVVTAAPGAVNVVVPPGPSPVPKPGAPKGEPVIPGSPAAPATTTAAPTRTAGAPAPAGPSGAPPTSVTSVVAPPAPPAPARVGWPPEQVYVMVCATCHEADGRGAIARKTMKDADKIPDLTDPTWQKSRTDADLEHSVLEGKGSIMLPRKDILAAAHTDVKEMVALMRRFQGGKQVITGVPIGQPVPAHPGPVVAGAGSSTPVSPVVVPATPAGQPTPVVAGPNPPSSTKPSQALVSPMSTQTTGAPAPAPSGAQTAIGSSPSASGPASPGFATASAGPSQSTTGPGIALPAALPISSVVSPERAAKLQAASEFYRTNCFACHQTDGKGTLVRPLMTAIPDFTSREWQTSRSNSQLQTSILEGKGTFMPPWSGKFTAEFARDLISQVRAFGPADLLTAGLATPAAATNFENQIRSLQVQWDEVEKQLRALNLPPAKP